MFGNIASGTEIITLVDEKKLTIQPFDERRLRLAHYLLTPAGLLQPGPSEEPGKRRSHRQVVDFDQSPEFIFQSQQYFLVQVDEQVVIPEGMVAQFVPSSSLVEAGFGLNAGKLDPIFGGIHGKVQKLRFGVSNLMTEPNTFDARNDFVYMYIFDFRGLQRASVDMNDPKLQQWLRQYHALFMRASDDGVSYSD